MVLEYICRKPVVYGFLVAGFVFLVGMRSKERMYWIHLFVYICRYKRSKYRIQGWQKSTKPQVKEDISRILRVLHILAMTSLMYWGKKNTKSNYLGRNWYPLEKFTLKVSWNNSLHNLVPIKPLYFFEYKLFSSLKLCI